MVKGKWGKALALGGALALGIWILWQLGLAALAEKGIVPEDALEPGQAAGAFLAALTGGLWAARRSGLGTLTVGLAAAAVFLGYCAVLGFLLFGELTLEGAGLRNLAAALTGGTSAGLLLSGRKRSRGGKRPRRKGGGRKGKG